jgi:hypothetical protein
LLVAEKSTSRLLQRNPYAERDRYSFVKPAAAKLCKFLLKLAPPLDFYLFLSPCIYDVTICIYNDLRTTVLAGSSLSGRGSAGALGTAVEFPQCFPQAQVYNNRL